jgi:heme exporter protein D
MVVVMVVVVVVHVHVQKSRLREVGRRRGKYST